MDLSAVQPGETRHDAFRQSIELAQRAEEWGYERFGVAEHHGSPSVAGGATTGPVTDIALLAGAVSPN